MTGADGSQSRSVTAKKESPEQRSQRRERAVKQAAAVTAGVVLLLSIISAVLLLRWHSSPRQDAFVRVAGSTRVETALEASRFWSYADNPRTISVPNLDKPADAVAFWRTVGDAINADQPLLFKPTGRSSMAVSQAAAVSARELALKTSASNNVTGPHPAFGTEGTQPLSVWVAGKQPFGMGNDTAKRWQAPLLAARCRADGEVHCEQSTKGNDRFGTLAVFAAVRGPNDAPDVAVAEVLAAHLARVNSASVSLTVIPAYAQADHDLRTLLQGWHCHAVTGGVVLGGTAVVSADTPALLRSWLSTYDPNNVIDRLHQVGSDAGGLSTALAALLVSGGVATAVTVQLVRVGSSDRRARKEYDRAAGQQNGAKKMDHADGTARAAPKSSSAHPRPFTLPEWLQADTDASDRYCTIEVRRGNDYEEHSGYVTAGWTLSPGSTPFLGLSDRPPGRSGAHEGSWWPISEIAVIDLDATPQPQSQPPQPAPKKSAHWESLMGRPTAVIEKSAVGEVSVPQQSQSDAVTDSESGMGPGSDSAPVTSPEQTTASTTADHRHFARLRDLLRRRPHSAKPDLDWLLKAQVHRVRRGLEATYRLTELPATTEGWPTFVLTQSGDHRVAVVVDEIRSITRNS